MKISQLITELENLKELHGDINVEVQYRDGGGCYHGTDTDVQPILRDYKWGKAIIL